MTTAPMIAPMDPHRPGPPLGFFGNRRSRRIEPCHLDAGDSLPSESEALRRRLRKIDPASAHVRTAIVDTNDHRLTIVKIRYARIGAERQRARSGGEAMRIEGLPGAGAAAVKAWTVP